MPRRKTAELSLGFDRDTAWKWLRHAEIEALWWPEKEAEHKVPREEMVRLRGELDRGASPEATIAKAKRFLEACGVLERVERIVARADERARTFDEKYSRPRG
jgi:hypothetical protein